MRPTTPTRVPAVLDRLLSLVAGDAVFAGVAQYDGAPVDGPDAADVIVFAPSTPDQAGIEVTYTREPGLGNAYVERVEVLTTISCWSGDEDMKAQRDRVMVLYGALQRLLGDNQSVDGVWDDVALGERAEWFLVPSSSGVTVAVGFYLVAASVV